MVEKRTFLTNSRYIHNSLGAAPECSKFPRGDTPLGSTAAAATLPSLFRVSWRVVYVRPGPRAGRLRLWRFGTRGIEGSGG
jgi:hypothetical protein